MLLGRLIYNPEPSKCTFSVHLQAKCTFLVHLAYRDHLGAVLARSKLRGHAPHCPGLIAPARARVVGVLTSHEHRRCTFCAKNHTSLGSPGNVFMSVRRPPPHSMRFIGCSTSSVRPGGARASRCAAPQPCLAREPERARESCESAVPKRYKGVAREPTGDSCTLGVCRVHSARCLRHTMPWGGFPRPARSRAVLGAKRAPPVQVCSQYTSHPSSRGCNQ